MHSLDFFLNMISDVFECERIFETGKGDEKQEDAGNEETTEAGDKSSLTHFGIEIWRFRLKEEPELA